MAKKKTAKSVSNAVLYEKLEKIERLLSKEEKAEEKILKEEGAELSQIEKLEKLEEEIKRDVSPNPLRRITYHDITKGLIGAFVGIVGHFAFFYGQHLAETLSDFRAAVLLVVSLILLVLFLYFSGFRRVEAYNKYLPIRVGVIYTTALAVSVGVLFLFGILHWPIELHELYLNVSAVSILAVMGAATADLIGGE
jgi:uncharacterized membrane protein